MLGVVGSLRQQRFLTACQLKHPEVTHDLTRGLFYRGWSEDMDIARPESLMMIGRRAGLGEEECLDLLEVLPVSLLVQNVFC